MDFLAYFKLQNRYRYFGEDVKFKYDSSENKTYFSNAAEDYLGEYSGKLEYKEDFQYRVSIVKGIDGESFFIVTDPNKLTYEQHLSYLKNIFELEEEKLKKRSTTLVSQHRLGRNDLCFCGSNRKYKNCCLGTETDIRYHKKVNTDDYKNIEDVDKYLSQEIVN